MRTPNDENIGDMGIYRGGREKADLDQARGTTLEKNRGSATDGGVTRNTRSRRKEKNERGKGRTPGGQGWISRDWDFFTGKIHAAGSTKSGKKSKRRRDRGGLVSRTRGNRPVVRKKGNRVCESKKQGERREKETPSMWNTTFRRLNCNQGRGSFGQQEERGGTSEIKAATCKNMG